MRDHITIYIGYYRNTILAASPDKKILKHYLKETRKLSPNEYTIRDSYMASENIYALYEDYLLEEYLNSINTENYDLIRMKYIITVEEI